MSSVIASYNETANAGEDEGGDADEDVEGGADDDAEEHNEGHEEVPAPSTPQPEHDHTTIDRDASAEVAPTVEPESAIKVSASELQSKVQRSMKSFFAVQK